MATLQEVNENVAKDLGELLDAGDSDMVMLVSGETRLRAHRAVLSDRSPVFGAMLHHDMLEASSGEVDIADVEGPVLREVLKYFYTLQAPQRPSMAPQLLAAADKYDLPALKAACEEQLVAQLSVETAAALAALAVRHSCSRLRQAAIRFIKDNLVQVMATQGWGEIIRYQPEELFEINRLVVAPLAETSAPDAASSPTARGQAAAAAASTAPPPPAAHTPSPQSGDASHDSRTSIATQTEPQRDRIQRATTVATQPLRDHTRTAASAATQSEPLSAPHTLTAATAATQTEPQRDHTRTAASAATQTERLSAHSQTPAAAAPPTAASLTPAPEEAAASRYRSLSAKQKGERLIEAANEGREGEVRALLAAGADVGAVSWWRKTALHYAAERGHAAVVRLLAAASADLNCRDWLRQTPLHWAAANGRTGAAVALLHLGADRAARDIFGFAPLDVAKLNNEQQLVELLGSR